MPIVKDTIELDDREESPGDVKRITDWMAAPRNAPSALPLEITDEICSYVAHSQDYSALKSLRSVNRNFEQSTSKWFFRHLIVYLNLSSSERCSQLAQSPRAALVETVEIRVEPKQSRGGIDSQLHRPSLAPPKSTERLKIILPELRKALPLLSNLQELVFEPGWLYRFIAHLPYSAPGEYARFWVELIMEMDLPRLQRLSISGDNGSLSSFFSSRRNSTHALCWNAICDQLTSVKIATDLASNRIAGRRGLVPSFQQNLSSFFQLCRNLTELELDFELADGYHMFPLDTILPPHVGLRSITLARCSPTSRSLAAFLQRVSGTMTDLTLSYVEMREGYWEEAFVALLECQALRRVLFDKLQYWRRGSGRWLCNSLQKNLAEPEEDGCFLWASRWADFHALRDFFASTSATILGRQQTGGKPLGFEDRPKMSKAAALVRFYSSLYDYRTRRDMESRRDLDRKRSMSEDTEFRRRPDSIFKPPKDMVIF